jgi:arylformamidase
MIRAHVPHWEANVADYRLASVATRASHPGRRTVAYGPGVDERLDLYFPQAQRSDGSSPIHLFIHGGYWRSFSKDDYVFVAEAITAAGAVAAIMDYSLLPAARMDLLVDQVRRAAHWLADNAGSFSGDPERITASGHSAGAHLASFLSCRGAHEPEVRLPSPRALLLVSGIYDLEPIARSFLQPELQLTTDEVARWSPIRATPDRNTRIELLVGGLETEPFHDQARAFEAHLSQAGARSRLTTVPGEDHMTIVRELGRPESVCEAFLAAAIAGTLLP